MRMVLTPEERRVLSLVLFLVVSGLAGQAWLKARPPRTLAPLPVAGMPSR